MVAKQPKPEAERKKPGRRSETLSQKLQRLESETALARAAVEQAEQLRLATIGNAVMAEAGENSQFMEQLRGILRQRVTTKSGKEAVASMLIAT